MHIIFYVIRDIYPKQGNIKYPYLLTLEKKMSKLEVVRAVDVGYGNTKYVLEH
jgi:hypothetical protein